VTRLRPRPPAIVALLVIASLSAAAADDSRPLPDRATFLRQIRARLRSDAAILRRYAYRRSVVERDRDSDGRIVETHTLEWEVRPLPDDPEGFRFLVARDSHPEPVSAIARREADYRRRLERSRRTVVSAGIDRARRQALEAETRREEHEKVADVFGLYELTLVRRDTVDGVPCVLVSFAPRPAYEPKTRAGGILKSVKGRAWFSDTEYELVQLESEAFESIRYGWGILARVAPGATARLTRRKHEAGEWLPARYEFAGRARVLLVLGVTKDTIVTFSDFRPAPPGSTLP
jgi:hypothetical protein